MQRWRLLSAAVVLCNAVSAIAQAASSTANPLNNFIGNAVSAVGVINSAVSQQTATPSSSSSSVSSSSLSSPSAASATPTQPAPAASSAAAAPPHHSNSRRNLIITIVCCIVGAILLIAAILTCVFCCLARRHRRSRKEALAPIEDHEKTTFQSTPPLNPGRTYSPHSSQSRVPNMDQQPTAPILASTTKPGMHQHAVHGAQNPFVPVPPNRRGGLQSKNGPTGATTQNPFVVPPITTTTTTKTYPLTQPLRAASRSRSRSSTLPTHATDNPPTTAFGMSGIGQPYEDMHVHTLQTDEPSPELRNSLRAREPIQRYSTPPLVPSRSPHRHSGNFGTTDSTPHSFSGESTSSSNTSNGTGSGEEWRRSQVPHREQRQQRLSNTATSNGLPAPPVPWDDGYGRRQSGGRGDYVRNGHGNDGSSGWIGGGGGGQERRGSRSPATSTPGTPRRLRFSDVPPERYGDEHRYSHGVGEAL
ncbi:hypothetical protein MMC07_000135 [Pseudocyphellaria aurata]|nr:hypothetical protein [Pseudocyphellaria aurata]